MVAICSARASNACSAVIIPEAFHPAASFDLNSKSGGGGGALGGAWNSALAKEKMIRQPDFQRCLRHGESPMLIMLSKLDSYKKILFQNRTKTAYMAPPIY